MNFKGSRFFLWHDIRQVENRLAYLLNYLISKDIAMKSLIRPHTGCVKKYSSAAWGAHQTHRIWVLDEPMTGLDPQASYDLKGN